MSVPKVGALPKVSRKKGRPPGSRTKSKTKSKEDPGPPYRPKRKRADSLGETFESKLKKLKTRPEANSGRKVGTSGSPASTKAITPDVIDLTDSDDEYKEYVSPSFAFPHTNGRSSEKSHLSKMIRMSQIRPGVLLVMGQ